MCVRSHEAALFFWGARHPPAGALNLEPDCLARQGWDDTFVAGTWSRWNLKEDRTKTGAFGRRTKPGLAGKQMTCL